MLQLFGAHEYFIRRSYLLSDGMKTKCVLMPLDFTGLLLVLVPRGLYYLSVFETVKRLECWINLHDCLDCVSRDHVFVFALSLLSINFLSLFLFSRLQRGSVWRPSRTTQRRGLGCAADRISPLSLPSSSLRSATAVILNFTRKVTLQRNWS